MVKIRLSRSGVRNKPCYRIVVADSRSARDGKFIEQIGFFNSIIVNCNSAIHNRGVFINLSRLNYWIDRGAILSSRVYAIVKRYNIKHKNDM